MRGSADACSVGKGRLDNGENCVNLIESEEDDPHCATSCVCCLGLVPMEIGGKTLCALPTCGKGELDESEGCDAGGLGCDNCINEDG